MCYLNFLCDRHLFVIHRFASYIFLISYSRCMLCVLFFPLSSLIPRVGQLVPIVWGKAFASNQFFFGRFILFINLLRSSMLLGLILDIFDLPWNSGKYWIHLRIPSALGVISYAIKYLVEVKKLKLKMKQGIPVIRFNEQSFFTIFRVENFDFLNIKQKKAQCWKRKQLSKINFWLSGNQYTTPAWSR